jgi:hypothetical protein
LDFERTNWFCSNEMSQNSLEQIKYNVLAVNNVDELEHVLESSNQFVKLIDPSLEYFMA